MYRQITEHAINPANRELALFAVGQPGAGGASHTYLIETQPKGLSDVDRTELRVVLAFQNGPIPEVGVNGLTHEVLLAIVADRLRAFQQGAFANPYNADALAGVESALSALKARTLERMQRGVEGTHQL